jgi:CRISP-associated protein Cas1
MKRSYYLFNPGRISRQDNTLKFTPVDESGKEQKARFIPVEGVEDLYCFGSLDANSSMYNFLGKNGINVHFFDYYEHYTGSFMAKEYLLAGQVHVHQVLHYHDKYKRQVIARGLIYGATANMLRNLKYYRNRGPDVHQQIEKIELLSTGISSAENVTELMGIEGNIRQTYYQCFEKIVPGYHFGSRTRKPPENELNVLISFGNMLCYATCLSVIYHTQLNPTISFLHEPGTRRYSLALDLSEIFKPVLVDRVIFSVLNKKQIKPKDFEWQEQLCMLSKSGKQTFVRAFEDRLSETIEHKKIKRKVSYKQLVKMECYKLVKHIMGIQQYEPWKAKW